MLQFIYFEVFLQFIKRGQRLKKNALLKKLKKDFLEIQRLFEKIKILEIAHRSLKIIF